MTATDSAAHVVIKDEPVDLPFDPNSFMKPSSTHNIPQYAPWHNSNGAIDPMELNMPSNPGQQGFGTSQSLSNFITGHSGVTDDDLLGSFNVGTNSNTNHPFQSVGNMQQNGSTMGGFNRSMQAQRAQHAQQQHHQQAYNNFSHTPEGAPIQSPFVNGFDYSQWIPMQSSGTNIPPQVARSLSGHGMNPRDQHNSSVSQSPMTPMTPGMGNLQLATPETGSYPGQPIQGNHTSQGHRHSSSATHWDSSFGSRCSPLDTPLSSPGGPMHPQISEVLRNGTPASPGAAPPSNAIHGRSASSAEMKKAKRRASHNEVERRRRNHINDQITALSRLVPSHRLEDDAIRRSLNSNATLPPNLSNSGASPPQATSLLAGGTGRRAAGNITQGLPIDEKDKGPAKGDVLNGAVGWTHDLLWMMHMMIQREEDYQQTIRSLSGQVNVHFSDEERRMRSELSKAFEQNGVAGSSYTRRHGSGLWVPGHTDQAGHPVSEYDQTTSASPRGASAGGLDQNMTNATQQSFWTYSNGFGQGRDSIDFKEEDELEIDLQ